jgi:hypothetical protein
MPFGAAAIIGGGALLGGAIGAGAAGRAADKSAGATRYAADLQAQIAREEAERREPWRQVGLRALPQLESYTPLSMEGWEADPGYQYRLQQGLLGVQGGRAAQGQLHSGNTLRALMDYGQNQASQEYGNIYNRRRDENTQGFNRLASLAGIGQTAERDISQSQQNMGNNLSNLAMQNAATQGQAGIAQANAWGGAIGGAANAFGNYYARQQNPWMNTAGAGWGGGADPSGYGSSFGSPQPFSDAGFA